MVSRIVVVGIGPGPVGFLTQEAREVLLEAPKIFFRISSHPVYHWLKERGRELPSFDLIYATPRIGWNDVYQLITQAIVREAELRGRAVYAVPGNPFVFEQTTRMIRHQAQQRGLAFQTVSGMSFLELVYTELNLDPALGLQIVIPGDLHPSNAEYSKQVGLLIGLIGMHATPDPECTATNVESVSLWLMARYPADHPVSLIWTEGMPDYVTQSETLPLRDLAQRMAKGNCFASLYVPPILQPKSTESAVA